MPTIVRLFSGNRLIAALAVFLLMIEAGGFTLASYASIQDAVDFYGDFHSPLIYEGITTKNIFAAAPFVILSGETKAWALATGNNDYGTALIATSIINRVVALALLMMIGIEIGASPTITLIGTYAFALSYRLIPYTQGMKFVAGLPLLLAWLFFLAREKNGRAAAMPIQAFLLLGAILSEQWIASFAAIFILVYTSFKILRNEPIPVSMRITSACIALASISWFFIERGRIIADRHFFINAFPELSLPDGSTPPPFISLWIITIGAPALAILFRKGKQYATAIAAWLLFGTCALYGIAKNPSLYSYIASPAPMIALVAITSLIINTQNTLLGAVIVTAGIHYILPYAGILILQSPYIASLALPFVLFSLPQGKKWITFGITIIALEGMIFIPQFKTYIGEWHNAAYGIGIALFGALLSYAMVKKEPYAH
jgi:hypothetical protein